MSAAVRELRHSLFHTVPFSSSLFLATVTTCLSQHTQVMSLFKQHMVGFHVYTCLYGFLLPQLLIAQSLPELLCLDFATKKKKNSIQSKKIFTSLRKAPPSLTPLHAPFYPTAFKFLVILNEQNKLM